jgi:hypothetical protein
VTTSHHVHGGHAESVFVGLLGVDPEVLFCSSPTIYAGEQNFDIFS